MHTHARAHRYTHAWKRAHEYMHISWFGSGRVGALVRYLAPAAPAISACVDRKAGGWAV